MGNLDANDYLSMVLETEEQQLPVTFHSERRKKGKKRSFLPCKCRYLHKLLGTDLSLGEKGRGEEQSEQSVPLPNTMWYPRYPLPMPPAVCLWDRKGRRRVTQGSPWALTTLASQCSLACNLVHWARYLTEEKSFQFQKLYWTALSWEISIDTKIPLKAPEDLLVPNRKRCSKRENTPLSIQRIL